MSTLVFPANNQAGRDYAHSAMERDDDVVLATSDENVNGCWWLPSVHSAEFAKSFEAMCAHLCIDAITCPVASVYTFMRKFIVDNSLPIKLIGKSPIQQELARHKAGVLRTARLDTGDLPLSEASALLHHASNIYGESNDEKIAAMIRIFSSAPKGNVVEIGSLAGRTAFVLAWLARRYHTGNTFSIDPWSAAEGEQLDSPALLTEMTHEWDWSALADIFKINMAVFPQHIHIRAPAALAFVNHPKLDGIAVLHIDGNHDYASVKQDCDLWLSRLLPGGWLILDDYEWAHGDGPKRVGDELLSNAGDGIEYFVAGKALFIQYGDAR